MYTVKKKIFFQLIFPCIKFNYTSIKVYVVLVKYFHWGKFRDNWSHIGQFFSLSNEISLTCIGTKPNRHDECPIRKLVCVGAVLTLFQKTKSRDFNSKLEFKSEHNFFHNSLMWLSFVKQAAKQMNIKSLKYKKKFLEPRYKKSIKIIRNYEQLVYTFKLGCALY